MRHQDWPSIATLYQLADFCFVSSLHDGMNLVAKEYVWSRGDATGALLLSRFTGASQDLPEAYQINPYDVDGAAEAIRNVLSTPPQELQDRMMKLRDRVSKRNAQTWADDILSALSA